VTDDRTLLEQIVLDEVADKNQAIHAYDRILWIVRSGYLTSVLDPPSFSHPSSIGERLRSRREISCLH
jgi:hypothetical protein